MMFSPLQTVGEEELQLQLALAMSRYVVATVLRIFNFLNFPLEAAAVILSYDFVPW